MWDVFISHASEDKDEIARPLADALVNAGFRVWFDAFALNLGDSLSGSINHGLAQARFGIVILSPAFFAKEWPQRELDGLNSREISGGKVILPVWHKVGRADVERFSPILADKLGVSTEEGLATVVHDVLEVLQDQPSLTKPKPSFRGAKRRAKILAAICGLAIAVGGAWLSWEVVGPAYARARLEAWPLEYSTARFIERAEQGDLAAVKLFLAAGMDPNQGDDDMALMAAAREGHLEVMKALLDGGASVNVWFQGRHPLMAAAGGGHLAAVEMLLEHGAEPDAINRALQAAAYGGNPEVVRLLLSKGANYSPENAISALQSAAYSGLAPVVGELLDKGANVNGKDEDGFSALTFAVRDDHLQAAALLLERGADINIQDKDGQTPLMWVATHEETARFLINKGADIHARNNRGSTVLMEAVSQLPYGSAPIVDLLLERGADPNAKDTQGATPLMIAIRGYPKNTVMIEKLLDRGAQVNVRDNQGYTPLMIALMPPEIEPLGWGMQDLIDIVQVLIKHGALVTGVTEDGQSALGLAKLLPERERQVVLKLLKSAARA